MFGIRFMKAPPTNYVIHFRQGEVVREGPGLSFFYFAPHAVIASVPMSSMDVPFVFEEITSDFQDATIQGELTFRVVDARRIAALLDYSLDASARYRSDDPSKLADRLIHVTQMLARSFTQRTPLRELLVSSDALVAHVLDGLKGAEAVTMLGIEVLALSIQSIKAPPEMSKAYQAEAREELLRKADEAIYARRNAAVQLERIIKENELDTEVAVEQKKRQVRETQMAADVAVEQQRAELVDRRIENEHKEADARAHALRATLDPLKEVDWRTLTAVAGGVKPDTIIALAFRELAENASKIGELNISPELLNTLLRRGK
ncbi:MAG: SPFH domain-containing protein [Pirellulales bacterium]